MPELTLRQQKFVEALTTPNTPEFCNQTAAYRVISPLARPAAQANGGSRMVRNEDVQLAIKGQLSLEKLGHGLRLNLREAKKLIKSDRPSVKLSSMREHRETLMDYAALTGQLIQRQQISLSVEQQKEYVRQVIAEQQAQRRVATSAPVEPAQGHDADSPSTV